MWLSGFGFTMAFVILVLLLVAFTLTPHVVFPLSTPASGGTQMLVA
jgi:hypothetical protein